MASSEKVCYILSAFGDYYLFIEELNNSKMLKNVIDLDNAILKDGEYAVKDPNIVLRDFASLCFCNVGDMLYMFEGGEIGKDKGKARMVYVFPLCSDLSAMCNNTLDRYEAQQSHRMLGPKVKPAAIRYHENKILVFSTNIKFLTCDGYDFEMYIAGENKSWLLPCLCVCYFHCVESGVARYTLFDSSKRCAEVETRTVREARVGSKTCFFNITSFSLVDGSLLVVQTDFGLLFCLNLEQNEWQFWDGPMFPSHHENFVTPENQLVLCPSGASVYTRGGDDSPGGTVHFPLSSHVRPKCNRRNSFISLAHVNLPYYFLCILQASSKRDEKPILTIDLVKVNVSKFMSDEDDDEDENEKFAECIMSFRFVSVVWNEPATPEALFLY